MLYMIVRYNFVLCERYILHCVFLLCAIFIVFSMDTSP